MMPLMRSMKTTKFGYNIFKIQSVGKPISKLKYYHNFSEVANRDFNKSNGLYNELYNFEVTKVMLASNLWHGVGLHNYAKGEVINFLQQ